MNIDEIKKIITERSFQIDELILGRLTPKECQELFEQLKQDPELQKDYSFAKELLQYFTKEKEGINENLEKYPDKGN